MPSVKLQFNLCRRLYAALLSMELKAAQTARFLMLKAKLTICRRARSALRMNFLVLMTTGDFSDMVQSAAHTNVKGSLTLDQKAKLSATRPNHSSLLPPLTAVVDVSYSRMHMQHLDSE
jgi:hypothetical protein